MEIQITGRYCWQFCQLHLRFSALQRPLLLRQRLESLTADDNLIRTPFLANLAAADLLSTLQWL